MFPCRETPVAVYLGWLCRRVIRRFWPRAVVARESWIQEEKFLLVEIPLPPLAEQRRVVARIEELAAQIHEARTLRIEY